MVRDSKGVIYYSDLEQVWRLKDGKKSIAVPNVHTHELYIDTNDNLYGEHLWFIGGNNDFKHYYWMLGGNGSLDTISRPQLAYRQIDFPLARDRQGNGFYVKEFVTAPDTTHIFKMDKNGRESIFASGGFAGIKWLHPQPDGSLLYVLRNQVHKVYENGAGSKAFPFAAAGSTLGGAWQDSSGNIYVALFEKGIIRKLSGSGAATTVYTSPGGWSPVFGLFDEKNTLWVLEYSRANEARVVPARKAAPAEVRQSWVFPRPLLVTALLVLFIGVVYQFIIRRKAQRKTA
jgi:hypothetical protein